MRSSRITRRRGLQIMLAFLGNVIPVLLACVANWSAHRTVFYIGAVGACVVPLLVTGLPAAWMSARRVAALTGLIALTMMQADTGGVGSGDTVLVMMAMVWFGVQASSRDVLMMIAVLCGCAYLPMLLIGPPAYPVEWAHATLLVLVGATVAGSLRLAVQETTQLTDRLKQAASTDPLTGLLNRRGWEVSTTTVIAQARRLSRPLTAAVLDLDAFKQLNDHFGHDEGDAVLRETAERLRCAFRAGDILARSGGDEFIVLLVDTGGDAALATVRRLIDAPGRHGLMSAGLAVWDPSEALTELLRRADLALYEAKRAGGGRIVLAPAPFAQEAPLTMRGNLRGLGLASERRVAQLRDSEDRT